ncbi:MAG: GxxExxY protein [Planctomycetaceae bacterium]|nr:GxxExxY protein [Planctomycetaceae bacterium]
MDPVKNRTRIAPDDADKHGSSENGSKLLHHELTGQILQAFYHVYNTLGEGFLEKVYENSLAHALRQRGLEVETPFPTSVIFDGVIVGEYFADLVVARTVVVEVKAADAICKAHEAQLLNYLRATRYEVGLLLNFGPKPEFRRKVYLHGDAQSPES